MLAIETRGLGRSFDGRVAVEGLDLEVRAGEVLGFLGPNGAGKTTTIRMLAGLIAPTTGSARVCGVDVVAHPEEVRRQVGLLTETPGLYERLSVWRNLVLFAELYGADDPAGRVERWLKRMSLWERREDPAGSLSKGMRQKVALCRALLHDPAVVFLDEPTSALDPEAAGTVRAIVSELREAGRTVFLTTHQMEEADRLCDRIAVFRRSLKVLDTAEALRHMLFGRQLTVALVDATDEHLRIATAVEGVEEGLREADRLVLRVDDPDRTAPAVIRALVLAGAGVRRVGEVRQPLERVYLELVGAS
ncbi:MAG: ABC transporter ATP-binding protein [Alphaproteobacteria bacterium]|nr:ABC transporter ATP-binding protein [Alphaproteobacteria bacterium]